MKKILFLACCLLFSLVSQAQTEFRKLSLAEALTAAKTENKLVFIDIYTQWCGPCKLMLKDVFPQKEVGDYMNEHFIPIQIDAEKGEGIDIARRFQITGYPTYVILTADDEEVGRAMGSMLPGEFVDRMKLISNPDLTFDKVKARYEQGDRSLSVVKTYAALTHEWLQNGGVSSMEEYEAKVAEVNKMVQDYFAALPDNEKMSADNRFVFLQYTPGITAPAAQYLFSHRKDYGNEAEADSLLALYGKRQVYSYLQVKEEADAAGIKALKKWLGSVKGLDTTSYELALKAIDAAKQGQKQYIAASNACYDKADDELRTRLISAISYRYAKGNEAEKAEAINAIRQLMPRMSKNQIYTTLSALTRLEDKSL